MSGQAASYYNPSQSYGDHPEIQHQQQQPYHHNNKVNNNGYDPNYQREPEAKPPAGPPPTYNQAVYGFDDAFKIERPKYNDIWAGLLVSDRKPLNEASIDWCSLSLSSWGTSRSLV
jgi:hypothetical protein